MQFRMLVKFFLLFMPFICWSGLITGQMPGDVQQTGFIHYTLSDGLSQVSVNALCKDKNGFLWIGTQNGLNRFDGSSFKVYKTETGGSDNICGNFINSLFQDSRGLMWIGTEGDGVCYFDPETGSFHRPLFEDGAYSVLDIAEAINGSIFLAIENRGILSVTVQENQSSQIQPLKGFEGMPVTALHVTDNNQMVVGTREGKVYSYQIQSDRDEIKRTEIVQIASAGAYVTTLKRDPFNRLWIGTRSDVKVLNPVTHALETLPFSGLDPGPEITNQIVYDIAWDKNNTCWLATGNGLYKLSVTNLSDATYASFSLFKANETTPDAISNNTIYCLQVDNDNGLLWVGTGKYLNLLVEKRYFRAIRTIPGNQQSLSSNVVFSILKVWDDLWVGTSDGGLNLIRNNTFYHYQQDQLGLPNNPVFSLAKDSGNHLWIGTKTGVAVLNLTSFNEHLPRFNQILHQSDNPHSLSSNFARQVYIDRKGEVWICTQLGGLNRFTGDLNNHDITFQQFRHIPGQTNQIASDRVYCVLLDSFGTYWIGTDAGLNKLTFDGDGYESPRFQNWSRNPDNPQSLSNNTVYCLHEDKKGMLWIGTRNGLNLFNPSTETFTIFNKEDGLPDNVIYSILEDEQGDIWVSTNNGIASLNPASHEFKAYNINDGLQNKEYNLNARFKNKNGMLYFGGIDGITIFNPDSLKEIDKETRLIFTALKYNLKTTASGKNEMLEVDIQKKVSLNFDNFPFYIGFTDVDVRPFKAVTFAYRLLPDGDAWNHIGREHMIQFPKLPPGTYTIEIQGFSRGKKWNSEPLSMILNVRPPWWRSLTAEITFTILVIILLYLFYKKRLQSALDKRETLEIKEISELKSKLFADITHEFRTPLTVIMGISNSIKSKVNPENGQLAEGLETIERNGEVLLHLVNQMLDLARLDKSVLNLSLLQANVVPYLQYIFECFESAARIKGIDIWFYKESESIVMDFDPDQLHKIVSNLLSNALKHTLHKGKIIFHVKQKENPPNLILKVKDSGPGIPEEDLAHIFERFYTIKARQDAGAGIGIGLSLTRELTELMGGTISVKNNQDRGSEFTVSIPITQAAPVEGAGKLPKIVVPQPSADQATQKEKELLPLESSRLIVLVIEDNKDVSDYIRSCLEHRYHVRCSFDGITGVDEAISLIPDMIISDIMMPGNSGIEVCRILKADKRTCHIPIILLTALAEKTERLKGLSAGADAYLTKPFNEAELLVRIEQLITLRQRLQKKYQNLVAFAGGNNPNDEFMSSAVGVIIENLGNGFFKASDMAFALRLSESQLFRKLKAVSGKSTALFIRHIRLQEARKLLLSSQATISEVAYSCGFNDPAWFSRTFKEEFGYSPSGFREENKTD